MTQAIPQLSLYEQDFVSWIDDTVAKLKAGKLEQLDVENLIEEIESLGRSEKREFKNRLIVLIAHILKRTYVNSLRDNGGWMLTVQEQRRQIKDLLTDSPSLRNRLTEIFAEVYQTALEMTRSEYVGVEFPNEWQFSQDIDAILSEAFWGKPE